MKKAIVILEKIYLLYLSLLPAVGTFVVLAVFDVIKNPLVFFGAFIFGTAGVGIYLAATASYTPPSSSLLKNIVLLIDGPIWASLAIIFGGSILTAIVDNVLIEIASILLGILIVTCVSNKPNRGQRIGSLFATGLPLLGVGYIFWTYAQAANLLVLGKILILIIAIIQGTATQFLRANNDTVHRDAEMYIIIGIILWVVALFAGMGFANSI